jgi:hypothetical protein
VRAGLALRVRIVLLAAEDLSNAEIACAGPGSVERGIQGRRGRGEDVDAFVDIAEHRRGPDPVPPASAV